MAGAASTAAASEARDVPPAFDGGDPHAFKRYERDQALWKFDTEVVKAKHGVRMIRQLTGPARAAADEVPLDKLLSEQGGEAVFNLLGDCFTSRL